MKDNKIYYSKAYKKQLWVIILSLTFIVVCMFATGLKPGPLFNLWIGTTLVMFVLILIFLRRQAKAALCPHCRADLFSSIQAAKYSKIKFNYCHVCGKEVKI